MALTGHRTSPEAWDMHTFSSRKGPLAGSTKIPDMSPTKRAQTHILSKSVARNGLCVNMDSIRDSPRGVKETSKYTKCDAKIARIGVCSPGVVHQFLEMWMKILIHSSISPTL